MLALIFSLFVVSAQAESGAMKQFYIIGGAGDPSNTAGTIFDPAFKNIINFLSNSGWQATVRFNSGGHPDTQKLMQDSKNIIPDQAPMSINAFNDILVQMERAAQTLPPGAQMLVFIDSHGAEKGKDQNLLTHNIVVDGYSSNLNTLEGSSFMNLDGLQKIISIANRRGVKIAVADMSCHSGNSLPLATEKTCVISATGPNLYATLSFAENFTQRLRLGQNLESVFLNARQEDLNGATLPMISTPAGKTVWSQEQALTGFLAYRDLNMGANKLYNLLLQDVSNCSSHNLPMARLMELTKNFETAFSQLPNGAHDPDLLALEKLIQNYQQLQSEIEQQLYTRGFSNLSKVETLAMLSADSKVKNKNLPNSYSWEEIISGHWSSNVSYYQDLALKEKNLSQKKSYLAEVDLMSALEQKQKQIYTEFPGLIGAREFMKELVDGTEDTWGIVARIAIAERKVYQKLYDFNRKKAEADAKNAGKGVPYNACQDFVL